MEDQSAPIPRRNQARKDGKREQPGVFLARGTHTVKLCSFDARNESQPGYSFQGLEADEIPECAKSIDGRSGSSRVHPCQHAPASKSSLS
jgi:hypothetical protein